MKHILVILFSIWSFCSSGQEAQASLPLSLKLELGQNSSAELVHLFVKGEKDPLKRFVQDHGGTYKYAFKNYHAVCLPPDEVMQLESLTFIEHIHFEHTKGQPLLSASLTHTNSRKVHEGLQGLPEGFTGEGVIIGVIDAGIELQHPDFQYADSSTRIIELWDQTMAYNAQRTPAYGYGQVWDSASINAGICPHQDQMQWFGHGTNTAGIAAGNGQSNPDYTGHAPNAELIIVSSDFGAIGWTNTVADAVDYIFSRAEALGKPCVINASLGTYLGSHDATDIASQIIEDRITESSGRAMVCAAGNSGAGDPYHLGYDVSSDTSFTWFELSANTNPGSGVIFFEAYGDVNDFESINFTIGADQKTPTYAFRGRSSYINVLTCLNAISNDSLYSTSGDYLANIHYYSDSLNGVYRMQFLIESIDSVEYNYRLMTTGSGRLDLWSAEWLGLRDMVSDGLPTPSQFPAIAHYETPDNFQSIVSAWACSEKVITVGNFINRNSYIDVDQQQVTLSGLTPGALAFSSSAGPSRKQITKPDVTAPGDNTLTAGAFFQLENLLNSNNRNRVAVSGLHHRAGGTSSASPVVAGIAALFFEHCNEADWLDLKTALHASARSDQFTDSTPNYFWGYGKADALGTLLHQTPDPTIQHFGPDFCEGDELALSLSPSFPSVWWSTGDSNLMTTIDQSGQYFAEAENDLGCRGFSDSVNLFERPNPMVPTLVIESDTPACADNAVLLTLNNTYGAYTWSNGSHLSSATINESGSYWCEVSNIYGCSSVTDAIDVRFFPAMPKPVLHFRSGNVLAITGDSAAKEYVWFMNDDAISNAESPLLEIDNPGVYQAGYIDSNDCVHYTDELSVHALGINGSPIEQQTVAYPNPFSAELNILSEDRFESWKLFDLQGALVDQGVVVEMNTLMNFEANRIALGSYFLELKSNERIEQIRVVKQ